MKAKVENNATIVEKNEAFWSLKLCMNQADFLVLCYKIVDWKYPLSTAVNLLIFILCKLCIVKITICTDVNMFFT